jgi:Tfp pilus tip-associated adhesin PilY1
VVGAFAAATFTPDAAPTGWVSRPVLTSNDLRSGQEVIFRADYKAGLWTGRVSADYIDALGELQGDSPWTGGNTMNILESTDWNADRRIVTRTSAGVAVPFRWAYMDAAQRTALVRQELLNFVRGDRSNESPNGQRYRVRDKIQGDIQHSSLVFWRHAGGATRLYVGGNDGMLHAFDAATGRESFAYVPSMLIPRLSRLTASPYVHSLYVDGGLSAANVQLTSGWRTLLAGALGGGGKGLFMLDVTNPSPANETEAAALVKWEVTPASTGFANLGYTYAKPRLARLNDGSAAVVVGNGYLNSGSGHATLFLINADTGALIREIDTGSGSSASPNGLSTPTLLDADQDGKVDYAYAGDLDGNLWKFDLRGASAAGYSASKLMTTSPQQAITSAPAVARGPKGGQMVVFGTGRILNSADAADTAAHYVYGVWDGAPAQNTAWLEQTLTEVPYGSQRLRQVTAHQPDWTAGGDRGWRLALTAGERVVGEGQFISDSRFYFTTSNPTVPAAAGGTATGANWVMEVDYTTGGSPPLPIFDINEDKVIDEHDNIGGAVIVGMYLGQGVSSQSVLVDLSTFSLTLFNRQSDIDYSVPTAADGPGVSGGHFDVDFYFLSGTKFAGVKHVHEYDDKYDVTGVNMLNASDPTLNLGSKLAATVDFKVLLINQYLNPAVTLSVGGGDFVSVKTFGGQATTTDAATLLANQTAYRLSNVNTLVWNLPVDAVAS